jgi:RNA polymerase sigma-70 factor (ECF subfamily)
MAARALEGQSAAWNEIVRRHSHRVRLHLIALGVPWDAAEDLVQEVWVRLVEQQRAGRLLTLDLPGLAIAQAQWLALETRRTWARRAAIVPIVAATGLEAEVADPHNGNDPAARAEQDEYARRVRVALAACPPRMRQVILAVYGGEPRTHAEVARLLGLSVQRVRQTVCEARARIRRALAEQETEDDES